MRKLLISAAALGLMALPAMAQDAVTHATPPKDVSFSFEGPLGTYDRGALQRGFQVYKEVCAACHSLDHIAFHNLDEAGGPGFTEPQAKAIAAGSGDKAANLQKIQSTCGGCHSAHRGGSAPNFTIK